jgi:hypothetical protein
MILLGILIFIVLTIAFYGAVALLLDTLMDCPFKKKEKPYMDNSEYDWGHNVKHTSDDE